MSTRYVVLGLARPRSTWFGEVGRWATSGSAPLEFIRCVAREELAANLASGRPFSAVLVDAAVHGLDRDLVELARRAGSATIVVDDVHVTRDWQALGVQSVLPPDFGRADLVLALDAHATALERTAITLDVAPAVADDPAGDDTARRWIAVTGAGSGTSVVAMALAQALGDPSSSTPAPGGRLRSRRRSGPIPAPDAPPGAMADGLPGEVVLADLALDADQAVLHGAPDIVPGVSELVEAARSGRVEPARVRDLTFAVDGRGYHLLLGLRRHRDWAALRPRAVAAAFNALAASFPTVVADVEPDVEGEHECGSVDIEERNTLSRRALQRADVVVAVGTADLKGVHALIRLLWRLQTFGIDASRIVPVLNRAPRHPGARAELARALRSLGYADEWSRPADALDASDARSGADRGGPTIAGPVFLPSLRRLDTLLRDGSRLPEAFTRPLAGAVTGVLGAIAAAPATTGDEPVAVRPGELGGRFDERAAS